jgi:hypothetical protein
MFEQFSQNLFESGYYKVEEVEVGRRYLARNENSETREKRSKVFLKLQLMVMVRNSVAYVAILNIQECFVATA